MGHDFMTSHYVPLKVEYLVRVSVVISSHAVWWLAGDTMDREGERGKGMMSGNSSPTAYFNRTNPYQQEHSSILTATSKPFSLQFSN